jgi:hypothetical protein
MFWGIPIIFIIIVLVGIAAIPAFKIKQEEFKRTGKHPKGHYMGLGIALGIPLGIPIGVAMGNISIGPALGVVFGVAIGAALEKKHENELRPLTEKEKELQRRAVLMGAGLLVLGLAAFVFTFFKANS